MGAVLVAGKTFKEIPIDPLRILGCTLLFISIPAFTTGSTLALE